MSTTVVLVVLVVIIICCRVSVLYSVPSKEMKITKVDFAGYLSRSPKKKKGKKREDDK